MAEESHRELLRRVAAQDHAALGELYDQIGGVLFSTAFHILGDQREAEEVVQDVFLQIWKKAATFDGALGTALHWTLGITRNRCIDCLRVRQRRSKLLDEATENAESLAPAPGPAPVPWSGLGSDEIAAVRRALNSLPAEQNQAIAMAFFGGMTHQEIAAALNEPLGTIKARIRRGMLTLRDNLKTYL